MYFIGIDIGTTSICGVIYDSLANTVESVTEKNDAAQPGAHGDERLQNPDRIIEIVENILNRFKNSGRDIAAIGITGQMHGMLYTDRDGTAISPLATWQDGRGNRQTVGDKTYAEFLSGETGLQLSTGYGLVTHFVNLRDKIVPEGAYRLATIMDYAVMRLTGNKTPVSDPSNAASLGFFDIAANHFDNASLTKAGIDPSILPAITDAGAPIGYHDGIPVFQAIGDNQAAFIGSVTDREKEVHVTVGTSSQISVYSPEYINIPPLDTRPLPGGGYIIAGAELCGGYSIALLKNFFAAVVTEITGYTPNDNELFDAMARMATGGDAPLKVETQFDGTRQNPEKRGSITGISSTNLLPGNMVEGFLRGICEALFYYYRLLPESLRRDRTAIVASGNGMRKNKRLREVFEEIFKLPVVLSDAQEEAAYGAAVFARKCLEGC